MNRGHRRKPDLRKQSRFTLKHAFSGWHILEAENKTDQDVLLRLYPGKNLRTSRLELRLYANKTRKLFMYLEQPGHMQCATDSHALSGIRLKLKWCFPFFAKDRIAKRLKRWHPLFLGMPGKDIFRFIRNKAKQNGVSWRECCLYYYLGTLAWCKSTRTYDDWMRFEESLPRVGPDKWPVLPSGEPITFGILLRVTDVPAKHVDMAVASILAQKYPHWRLYIAGALPPNCAASTSTDENAPIRIQSALAYPWEKYSYTLLMNVDTLMRPETLACLALTVANNPDALTIYADEDRIDSVGRRSKPHLRTAWNPDLFLTRKYFSMPLLLRTDFVANIDFSAFHEKTDCVYPNLVRHMTLLNAKTVARAPQVLFHKTTCADLVDSAESETRVFAADSQHLAQWAATQNPRAQVESDAATQTRRLIWELPDPAPSVSILVPTRDKLDVLRPCVQGILNTTSYRNFELIILDNDSRKAETWEFLREISGHPKVCVLSWNHPFNYSAINNFGAAQAKGEILCLCNNDIEPINPEWLTEMVSQACRPEIGCVGAKLYYPDDTIQHGGVLLGVTGTGEHAHRYSRWNSRGYQGRLLAAQNFSAVTGACLAIRKNIYEAAGGLNERDLPVAFNDVDFCLRVQAMGYRNLWTPHAELYHREFHSRGHDITPQQQSRAQKEADYMHATWAHLIHDDPFYNPNLMRGRENFELR